MKINKQLFEDVLSGKLKGVFVLENTRRVSSNELRLTNNINPNYPYCLINDSYTNCGRYNIKHPGTLDIVDFIPETNMKENMKENELAIEIPEGKIVDWGESKKQNKIVLKDKQLTYKDVCKKLFENKEIFYIGSNGDIGNLSNTEAFNCFCDKNNAITEHQLECIIAKNQLANVAIFLNDGWKPQPDDDVFLMMRNADSFSVYPVANGSCASDCGSIWFKSKELAQQAIEILGEETVKLALEPLGV